MSREALGVDDVYPYSKIIKANGFVYVKSHVGIDPATDEIPADISAQTRLTLEWLQHALATAGADIANLVKVSVYLADIDRDFEAMDRTYNSFLAEAGVTAPPARTTVGVPLSWPQLLVQMDCLAVE